MKLEIFRSDQVLAEVSIDKNTVYRGKLMGENKIVASFVSATALGLQIGDYIVHKNQEWRINEAVKETKTARNHFLYDVIFEGREYTWHNKLAIHLGSTSFSYFGTLNEVLVLILDNINQIDGGWILGEVDDTEPQLFTLKDVSCAQALSQISEQCEVEYKFEGRTLHVKETIGYLIPGVVLSQGKKKGLYTLSRQSVGDAEFGTKVFGYGGSTNLPLNYRNGIGRLSFDPGYIENNVDLYGVIEKSIAFEDIFPKRTAAITGTDGLFSVTDTTLDFNLNDVIVQGQAKIVFKSGDLGSNEFEIDSYDHATKTIVFFEKKEESGYILPNPNVKAEIGDTYTLVGISMPPSYIADAENDVKERTRKYADSIKHPPQAYSLEIDQLEAKRNGLDLRLTLGDKLTIVEDAWSIEEILRVQAITYPLINPAEITAVINDKATYTVAEKIRKEVANHEAGIKDITRESAELRRINAIRRKEFQGMVFDPEGYFDPERIKKLSVETMHLAVGSRSQELSLTVIFKTRYEQDENAIGWTKGVLTHFVIEDQIRDWTIAAGFIEGLAPSQAYYAYAKCYRNGNTGTIVIDQAQRKVDSDPDYYYFLLGAFSSVIEGSRWPTLSYGTFEANGGFIKGNRITSNDGLTYFDLDTGQIVGNISVLGGNAETKAGAQQKADGALAASKTYVNTEISGVNGKILLKADNTTVNALGQRVTNAEASISVFPGQIATKVSAGDIASAINQTPQAVKINASKIELQGALTISAFETADRNTINSASSNATSAKSLTDAWRYGNTTDINGAVIRTGTLIAVDVNLSGHINAVTGQIGDFKITTYGLLLDTPKTAGGLIILTPGVRVQLGSFEDPYWPGDTTGFNFASGLFESRLGLGIVSTASGGGFSGNFSFYSRKGHIYLRDCLELNANQSYAPKFSGHLRWILGSDGNRYMVITDNSLFPE